MRKGLFFIVLYCFSFGLIREGLALPVIEEIISGSATVSSPDQSTLVINASDQAIINYSSFDILKNETVSISLPDADSIILNRIISGSSSSIMGSLSCNGILLLINSAGLSFGPQSEIDVSSLIASTRDITNSDFLASHYIFNKNNSEYIDRLLLNQGNITISKGGFGIFIAGAVENQGIISAELGTISLVSGDKATVSFSGNDLISVAIDKAAVSDIYDHEENKVSDSIRNTGIINTEGGEILLKSEVLPELFENAINLQGIIKADTVEEHGGMISIVSSGKIQSDSVISAGTVQIKAQGDISLQKPVSAGKGGISVLSDQTVSVSSDIYSQGDVYFYSDYDADGKGDFYQSTGIIKTEQHGDISIECPGQMALNKIEAEQGSIKICTEQKPGSVLTRPEYIRSPGTISIVSTEQANTVSSIQTAEDDYLLYNTEQGVVLKADKTTIAEQGPTDLYGNIVFYNFNLIQPGKELRFEPDKSYTFLGNTIIKGSGYDVLRLVSQEKGRQWNISIPDNDYLISLAGIEDSCNTGTELLISEPSLNLGNNSGWFIDPFWVGAGADNNWSTALNWWPIAVPGAADIVTFDGTDHTAPGAVPDKDAVVDAGFSGTISSLSVDGYTGTITLNNSLIVNNALFINSGNINSNGQDFDIGSFTQTGGSFTAGASAITCSGDFSLTAGTFNADTSILTLDISSGNSLFSANGYTFNSIEFYSDSASARTVLLGSGTISFNDNFYITAAGDQNIIINASVNNPDLTIAGDLDFTGAGAGTESINMGNGTWQISGTVDFREGTVDAGHSLLYKTGTYETIYGDGQTLWDLWLTTTTELADSDLYIDNSLTVNGYLFIDSSVTLRLNDNAFSSFTANANVMNPGMIEFVDSACSNITLTGLIKTKTRFTASAEDINIPPLTLYGPVEFYNAGAEDRTVTLGTAAGQNLTLGSVFINAADDGDLALDAAAWNPDITVYGDLDFTGTGSGTEFLSLGNGAWTVGGNIDFTDGILNPGTSPVYMNASSWDNLGLGTGYHPYVICVYDGKLIAGGEFTEAGGNSINKIAAWDGTEWSSLGPGLGHYVYDLTVYNGNLIAGGYFNNDIAAWDGTEWSSLGSGISGGAVYSLTVYNGNLIAAGGFTTAGGAPANRIAQWDGANWSSLGSGMNAPVSSLYVYDGKLFAGGNFTTAGGVAANCIAAWDGANWSSPGSGMSGGSTAVLAMTVYDNKLITGGNFNSAGGVAANCIAAWDGANWFSLGSGVSHLVKSMLIDNGKLIAAGTFSKAGGQIVNYIASWDGTDWSALGSGFDREVYDICSYNGGIAAVGRFTNAGIEAEHVAVMDNTALLTCGNQTLNQLVITNNTDFDRTVTLSGNLSLNSDLMIDCQKTGAITLDAAAYSPDLNISGNFGFTGAGSGSETFNMGSGTWTVAGDADLRNGTFICNASSFILNGSDQTVYGSNTFFNFSKAGSNGTLYFEQGSTQNITGSLVLQGSDLLYLRSTAEGIQWNIDPQATVTASFLDVKDSCNLNALEISASDSVDSLNNTNWVFLSSVQDDPDPAIDDNVLAQEMPDPENITYNSQLPDLASEPPDDNIALSDDPGSSPVNTENSDLSSGPGTTDTADPASDPVTADCAEKRTNDGFDYSQLWEDRGKKKKKNYRKAKYTTTVILYEGKVIMDPYSEKGQDKAQRRILFPGEKTAQSCTVK